jgi:hypothetical protein
VNEKILNEGNQRYTILYCVNICDLILVWFRNVFRLRFRFCKTGINIPYQFFFGKYATEFLITCIGNSVLPAAILWLGTAKILIFVRNSRKFFFLKLILVINSTNIFFPVPCLPYDELVSVHSIWYVTSLQYFYYQALNVMFCSSRFVQKSKYTNSELYLLNIFFKVQYQNVQLGVPKCRQARDSIRFEESSYYNVSFVFQFLKLIWCGSIFSITQQL